MSMLSRNNHKIRETGNRYFGSHRRAASFDLLAGHNCPAASLCHSRVNVDASGKRTVEDLGIFRCYAVKAEVQYPDVYNKRANNRIMADSPSFVDNMIQEIQEGKFKVIRIHSSGDFYNYSYFQKWIQVIEALPDVTFFAYTKQASFVQWAINNPHDNLGITYSYGGIHDNYALSHNLPSCTVVLPEFKRNKRGDKFYNPYKNVWEVLSCTHVNPVDDFEYVMSGVSFGIAFH